MHAISASTSSLLKIDFAQALLRSQGIVAGRSVSFEEPGTLAIACVSYARPVPTVKPAGQAYHGIGYRISGAVTLRTDKPRTFARGVGRTGMTAVVPAEEGSTWRSLGPHEMIHFYLAADFLNGLARALYDIDVRTVELQEAAFHHDATLARYALNFHDRLFADEALCALELNACAQLLGAHLLRCYSSLTGRRPVAQGEPMTPGQLRAVTEYIWAHLDAPLRLGDLADVAAMDQYRFARAFQASAGVSPHKYVVQARLARAQELLQSSRMPLSAIAVAVGFSSQSHMTLTFQKVLAVTPGRYRQAGRIAAEI